MQQLDVVCDTKTKDSVFVTVTTSIQYEVESSSAEELKKAYVYGLCDLCDGLCH